MSTPASKILISLQALSKTREHINDSTSGMITLEVSHIQQMSSGDEAAFNMVYLHYTRRLYFFALRFVSDADAQDTVAEAFAELWQKRAQFQQPSAVQHFLFVIVRNRCLNILRRQSVQLHNQAEILNRLELMDNSVLDREALTSQLVDRLFAEINRLPARQKEIILLSFKEGLKPAEIAQQLNLNVQTVSNQKLTAIRVLQHAMNEKILQVGLLIEVLINS